jgi:hypothetical protein
MTRRRGTADVDPLQDLPKKIEILEREMAIQRAALEKLKEIGSTGQPVSRTAPEGTSA